MEVLKGGEDKNEPGQ